MSRQRLFLGLPISLCNYPGLVSDLLLPPSMQFILPTLVSEICCSLGLARSQCQDRDYSWDYPLVSDYPGLVSDLLLPPSMQFILPTLVSEICYSLGLVRIRSPQVSAPADLWSYGQDGRVSVVFESLDQLRRK